MTVVLLREKEFGPVASGVNTMPLDERDAGKACSAVEVEPLTSVKVLWNVRLSPDPKFPPKVSAAALVRTLFGPIGELKLVSVAMIVIVPVPSVVARVTPPFWNSSASVAGVVALLKPPRDTKLKPLPVRNAFKAPTSTETMLVVLLDKANGEPAVISPLSNAPVFTSIE